MPARKTRSASPAVRRVREAFADACDALPPLAPGARLMLGCSAGGDSVALLDLVADLARGRRWQVAVVHVDHGQRAESAEEAEHVAQLAKRRKLTCFVEHLPAAMLDLSPLSEEVMREARHEIFRECIARWDAGALVLAHHADDQAETFLIRLLAGSGPTGLSGIRPVERLPGLTLVRPLLAARRADLRQYLEWRGLEWREDPSNADLATKRGWVREALLPSIRDHIGLDPTDRIARAAALIAEEAGALGEAVALLLSHLARPAEPPAVAALALDDPAWVGAGPGLRRRLLRQWLWTIRKRPHPPGFKTVNEALAFVERGRAGTRLRTIEHIQILKRRGRIEAHPPKSAK